MNKIAILTIQCNNYGNRLQNYATQKIIEEIGCEACSLLSFKHRYKNKIYMMMKSLYYDLRFFLNDDFDSNFYKFNKSVKLAQYDYIRLEDYYIGEYDAVIVGSDQIWNTNFTFINENFFLPFKQANKIAFSASFGVDSIPYDQKIVDCLKDFKALSVREEAGAKIIKELTGIDATVLVDPTMLLTVDEWRKVEKKPRGIKESKKTEKPKDGYILTYFLSPKCDEAKKQLEEVKGDREVYELLNLEDKVAGTAGPSEFLWLFDHADIILTDSFHACVFSFLFNKPFMVFDRQYEGESMNSRLETLLSKFHLERKYASSGLENDIWEHDYEEGYKQLELEREKAMNFLKEALEEIK